MGQITQESNFGSKLKEMTERDDVKTIIEIGTWNGQGSTKCILSGMNNTEKHLYSLEANKSMYEKCVNYYTPSHPNLTLLYGTLHRNIMNVIEIVTHPMFNKVRDHFFLHYTQDVIDITKSDLVLLPIDNVDMVVLDGGEFSTLYDWNILQKLNPKIVALDDVNVIKTHSIYEELVKNGWVIVAENLHERNGWSILERIPV